MRELKSSQWFTGRWIRQTLSPGGTDLPDWEWVKHYIQIQCKKSQMQWKRFQFGSTLQNKFVWWMYSAFYSINLFHREGVAGRIDGHAAWRRRWCVLLAFLALQTLSVRDHLCLQHTSPMDLRAYVRTSCLQLWLHWRNTLGPVTLNKCFYCLWKPMLYKPKKIIMFYLREVYFKF